MAVEVVGLLPIEGVLDYGSRGGVNINSIQQSAFSTWHLALGHSRPLQMQIEISAQADWEVLCDWEGLGAKCQVLHA